MDAISLHIHLSGRTLHILEDAERATGEFRRQTAMNCPPGCGDCCRNDHPYESLLAVLPAVAAALAEQQQKLAQAQADATRIRSEAEQRAKAAREAVMAQSAEDIGRMKAAAAQDLTTQQDRVLNELRQRIAALAMQRAEEQLRSEVNEDRQRQLIDQSIARIGGL